MRPAFAPLLLLLLAPAAGPGQRSLWPAVGNAAEALAVAAGPTERVWGVGSQTATPEDPTIHYQITYLLVG